VGRARCCTCRISSDVMNHEDTWVGRHLMDDSGSESKTGIRAPLIFCTSPKPHVTGDPCEHVFAHAISEVGQDIWMSWLPGTFTYSAGGNSGPRRTLTKKEKDHFFLKAQNP